MSAYSVVFAPGAAATPLPGAVAGLVAAQLERLGENIGHARGRALWVECIDGLRVSRVGAWRVLFVVSDVAAFVCVLAIRQRPPRGPPLSQSLAERGRPPTTTGVGTGGPLGDSPGEASAPHAPLGLVPTPVEPSP